MKLLTTGQQFGPVILQVMFSLTHYNLTFGKRMGEKKLYSVYSKLLSNALLTLKTMTYTTDAEPLLKDSRFHNPQ